MVILFLALAGGVLLAFSMGANDVSNAMAPSVSSKAVSWRQAVMLAAVLDSAGAIFLGAEVAGTVATGLLDTSIVESRQLMLGMLATLFSAGIWVFVATLTGLPVSTTHSVVGGIIGVGIAIGGPSAIRWGVMSAVVLAWLLSPVCGALIGYVIFAQVRGLILYSKDMAAAVRRWAPVFVGLTAVIIALSLMYKTPWGKRMDFSWSAGLLLAVALLLLSVWLGRLLWARLAAKGRTPGAPEAQVEAVFKRMQVFTACYVALSHGANDVANAIGPVVVVYIIAVQEHLPDKVEIPFWLLALGGAAMAAGTIALGRKVVATVGERITAINNSRGFAIDFGAATTVLLASMLGLPVSTTHASVGAVVGVGLARGFGAVDFRVFGKILLYWALTLPIAAFSSTAIYFTLAYIFV
jgi:PiT family inorganic phosphate transporter